MERITRRDVSAAYCRMIRGAVANGLDVTGWALNPGSATYGRAWGVVRVDPETGGYHMIPEFPPFGAIGTTAREAHRFLSGMAAGFEAVAARREGEQA